MRVDVEDVESFVQETMVPPTSDEKGLRVDFLFSITPFERAAIERAREVKFDEVPVRFASLEDLIIHKMVAGRPRDIEDVRSILAKNPDHDRLYIRNWLSAFDAATGDDCRHQFDDVASEIAKEAGNS